MKIKITDVNNNTTILDYKFRQYIPLHIIIDADNCLMQLKDNTSVLNTILDILPEDKFTVEILRD